MEVAKNFHQNYEKGLVGGLMKTGVQYFFGPGSSIKPFEADYTHINTIADYTRGGQALESEKLELDGTYLVDKLTDVYHSGTSHDEQQPAHLKIIDTNVCATTCKEEYGNPCTKFCPAQVYNMRGKRGDWSRRDGDRLLELRPL